jgi:probable HAF family extracellular repeat protein
MARLIALLEIIRRNITGRDGRRGSTLTRANRRFALEGLEERCLLSGFSITDLGTLGGNDSRAAALNQQGDVVGQSTTASGATHAFLYTDGEMIDLGTLGGRNSYAFALNDKGDVVGKSETGTGTTHAFLYTGGTMIDINPFGSSESYATGINDQGDIVGSWKTPDSFPTYHAFLYTDGDLIDPGTLGGRNAYAAGINNKGQMIGQSANRFEYSHAFMYQDGDMTDLGTLGGIYGIVTWSDATGINDLGQVVGGSYNEVRTFYHAFAAQDGDISDLDLIGTSYSLALAVNNWSMAVGHSMIDQVQRASLFWQGSEDYPDPFMLDLNDYLIDNLGWTLTVANSINDSAQIVGWGLTPDGIHAFLLNWQDDGLSQPTVGLASHARSLGIGSLEAVATLPTLEGSLGRAPLTTDSVEQPAIFPQQGPFRQASMQVTLPDLARGKGQETSGHRLDAGVPSSYFDTLVRSEDSLLAPWADSLSR